MGVQPSPPSGDVYTCPRSCRSRCRTVERIHGHRVAKHVDVAVLLRQPLGERLPFTAARAAAENAQLAVRHEWWESLVMGTT